MKAMSLMIVAMLATACGSAAPTSPSPSPTPAPPVVAPQPAPQPDPEPTPAPAPAPLPTPRGYTFDAELGFAHWWGAPVFPGHFEVRLTPGRVEAGAHGYDVLDDAPGHVYVVAGTRNLETLTIEYHGPEDGRGVWTFTYSGRAGEAYGGLVRR